MPADGVPSVPEPMGRFSGQFGFRAPENMLLPLRKTTRSDVAGTTGEPVHLPKAEQRIATGEQIPARAARGMTIGVPGRIHRSAPGHERIDRP
jgi:hypothetical protein